MCTSSPHGGLRGEFEESGCRLVDLKWKRTLNPATVYRLIKVLNTEKPDIIFITEPQELFYYRIARIFWRRKVVQIGSFRALTFWKGHLKKYYKPIDNYFAKWLYASSEHVIVNSFAMEDQYSHIIKIMPGKSIKTIYNGSDFNFRVSKPAFQIRQELNITAYEVVIIIVSRLDPWKDFVTLFEAAKIVVKADSRAKFLIVGDGELRNTLEQMIYKMDLKDNVLLVGEKKDVYNYLNAADISVLSTNGEGFSNAILESMALCKPVIATNVGGNPELLGVTNESGILVSPKSPEMFADAILHLMRNEVIRQNIGQAAKERIQQLCSIKKYISSYEELFLQSLNKI
jgi:glycosyltransferase involved in cell wall biosynthesis